MFADCFYRWEVLFCREIEVFDRATVRATMQTENFIDAKFHELSKLKE